MINTLYSACYHDSGHPFNVLAKEVTKVVVPTEMTEKDSALVIWGGADIDPELYNHPMGSRTYTGGKRDWIEWALMSQAIEMGIPIFGVCRGAQMLCAAAGGYLIQHVENHAGSKHNATTSDGKEFSINSIHHQMMVAPPEVDHQLLAWSTTNRSSVYLFKDDHIHPPPDKEPEFIYFPKIKGYAIQWHPEGMDSKSEATQFIFKVINDNLKSAY